MLRKLLMAALVGAYTPPAVPQTAPMLESIPLVFCPSKDGFSSGTAFRVGPNLILSVAHVTSLPQCFIDGEPINIIHTSSTADFSILSDDRIGDWIRVDCAGFVKGRLYLSIGHARGMEQLTIVPMIFTGEREGGQAMLAGVFTAQPGMSGGPVIDAETHEVVGTTNTADWEEGVTGSVELRATSVCKR
jgi:hypothetical protein